MSVVRPIQWLRLRADEAERLIRSRSADSANVVFIDSWHAGIRSRERDILRPDVYSILRQGTVTDAPLRNARGDWEAIIRRRIRGARDAAVVTIILRANDQLIVKTVMWIDP